MRAHGGDGRISLVLWTWAAGLALVGCPLAHDTPRLAACLEDRDCFVAEGELCDRSAATDPAAPGTCRVAAPADPEAGGARDASPADITDETLDGRGADSTDGADAAPDVADSRVDGRR